MSLPRCSVLMPMFNGEEWAEEAIGSIQRQTIEDWELIAVDDGSTDRTVELFLEKAKCDPRIRLFRRDHGGIVRALNFGFTRCRSPFIARFDVDDRMRPDRLERQLARLERQPDVVVLGGAVEYIDEAGRLLGRKRHCEIDRSLLWANPLLHPTVLIRREALIQGNLQYQERFRYAEDYFLWLQLSCLGRLDAVPDVVVEYRLHPQASRFRRTQEMLRAGILVKIAGIKRLRIRPTCSDLLRIGVESLALGIPAAWIRALYIRGLAGFSEGGLS